MNLPRWKGQDRFFEIWFVVVFEPHAGRAYWFRYTTFAPARGAAGGRRATVWAAAFDVHRTPPVIAAKAVLPADAYDPGTPRRFGVRLGESELGHGFCRGTTAGSEHAIAWDLRFAPSPSPVHAAPWFLHHRLPLPTRVAHAHSGVAFDGWVEVNGDRRSIASAIGVQKHLWGTRRVEDLLWLYCPRFAEDPAARLEATAVRPRRGRRVPWLTLLSLKSSHEEWGFHGTVPAFRNRAMVGEPGELAFRAGSLLRRVDVRAWCDPRSLAGYVYRDPAGWDVHVAQSDVGSCRAEVFTRKHPWGEWRRSGEWTAEHSAALEFHSREGMPGVRYLGW